MMHSTGKPIVRYSTIRVDASLASKHPLRAAPAS
jgi:hypothetical protein